MQPDITEFKGSYRWLSNFWPLRLEIDGEIWPSVENFYQAQKTLVPDEREQFTDCGPAAAKRRGRKVTLRLDWDEVKEEVMLRGLREKFKHPELRELLLRTGDCLLMEGNRWGDTYWGVCFKKGCGQNRLGQLLMLVREEIRNAA